jgi:NodT family efflux transporter outer membrane factor (OMF) lipoprotein
MSPFIKNPSASLRGTWVHEAMQSVHRGFILKISAAVLSLAVFAGCTLHHPQRIDLPVILPDSFIEDSETDVPVERWWETFEDEKLNQLMEEAFSSNLDLAQAYARLEQAEAVFRTTRSTQYPSLNGHGDVRREDTPGFFGNNTGNSFSYSLAAAFELDFWQKRRSSTKAARLDMEASLDEVHALYLRLSANLVDLYYLAVEQRAQIELVDRTIESFSDTLKRVERRYREGLVPALDVYQARQNLAGAESARPIFEAGLAQAEHGLAVLLGRYPDRESAGDVAILPETPESFPAGLPSDLLARRPDIQAALLRVEASDARVAAAIADRFPSFNLLGSWGRSKVAFSTGDIRGEFWNIMGDGLLPIFDAGRRRAEVNRNRALFDENLARYQAAVLTAFREVEDALARNQATEKRIARLEEQVKATSGSLRLSLERYLQGLSDYLPVLTAQASDAQTRSDLIAARRQLISDRVSLARALGGEWMEEQNQRRLTAEDAEKK